MDIVDGITLEFGCSMFLGELTFCHIHSYIFIEEIEVNSCSMLAIMVFRVGVTYCKGVKIIQTLRYSNKNFKTLVPIERSAFLDPCKASHRDFVICYLC